MKYTYIKSKGKKTIYKQIIKINDLTFIKSVVRFRKWN